MAYWLMKSEPFKYSWQNLLRDKKTWWDGVRNHQAAKYLRAMQVGDSAFFYHSNEDLAIMGLMQISQTARPDPSDETEKFVMVEVKPSASAATPLTLAHIKATSALANMQLLKQMRLSVSQVTAAEFKTICKLAGIKL